MAASTGKADATPKKVDRAKAKVSGTARVDEEAHAKRGKAADPGKYTDPALREQIKQRVLAGDKGGNPGQWSARKAQIVAHEYEAEGGGFTSPPDESQQHLRQWGDEHWTTSDGKPAKREDGMHRYLPEAAWEKLSAAEKRSDDKKKVAGSKTGKQFVANTGAAKKASKAAKGAAK